MSDRSLWPLWDLVVLLPGGQVTRDYRAWRPTEAEAVAEVLAVAPVGSTVVTITRVTRRVA